jgi:hypothetical protein
MREALLIALDDFVFWDFDKLVSVMHALYVADGLATRRVDHAERDRLLRGDGRTELYRNKNEGQAKIA